MSTSHEDTDVGISTTYGFYHEQLPDCPFCEWQKGLNSVKLDTIRRGAQQRSCCAVLLDAIETWSEVTEPGHTVILSTNSSLGNDNKISFCVGLIDDGDNWTRLVIYRSQTSHALSDNTASRVVGVIPKWAEGLDSIRPWNGDTSSIIAFRTLKAWLRTCNRDHGCYAEAGRMPRRVIEVTKRRLFLREGLVENSKYACLSHCWGIDGLMYKLSKANRLRLCQGFMIWDLPKTFQDAVKVCLQLGIRFLWIDALCIVQDDLGDWTQTSAAMADIYRNAFITIAATSSRNSSGGLFRHSPAGTVARPLQRMPGLVIRELSWPDFYSWNYSITTLDNPLLQRGWVFQERRMSPRMVHFTSTQLVWECRKFVISEDGIIIRKEEIEGGTQTPSADELQPRSIAWRKTVREYSGLDLSFEQDRLPAIAAIVVEEMKHRPKDTYIVGMWKDTFLDDILWYTHSSGRTKGTITNAGSRPDQSFPSWSWASVKGGVRFKEVVLLPGVQVVGVSFTGEGPPQMGCYIEATITIRGPLINAVFRYDEDPDMNDLRAQSPTITLPSGIVVSGFTADFDFWSGRRKTATASEDDFSFILIGVEDEKTYWGLVLRQRSGSEFERVGTCVCYHYDSGEYARMGKDEGKRRMKAYIDSLPVKKVTIV